MLNSNRFSLAASFRLSLLAGSLLALMTFLASSLETQAASPSPSLTSTDGKVPPGRAPFRTLFSNDLTNIMSCPSPFHSTDKGKGVFTEAMLRASVDETAGIGIDVHMLQPGLGWEPWWPSKIYPMSEHVAWMKSLGEKPWTFHDFVLNGGDIVKIFIDECRKKGLVPFISQRMNDVHNIYRVAGMKDPKEQARLAPACKFCADHPEYWMGPGLKEDGDRMQYAMDWDHPEVRDFKLKILDELCANYDFNGLELDFLRHFVLFKDSTPKKERRAILLDFVTKVRAILDHHSKPGEHRWLSVRVPGYVKGLTEMGIDLPAWAKAGVDMVNVSDSYHTDEQMDLAAIRKMLPSNVAIYEETHFNNATAGPIYEKADKNPRMNATNGEIGFRRMTDAHFYTAAHMAYARGLQGVSTFNFQYYRGSSGVAGTPSDPPYHIFEHLRDPAWLALQPQLYAIGVLRKVPGEPPSILKNDFHAGDTRATGLDMAPPTGGWKKGGRLRIQAKHDLGQSVWMASINGVELKATDDVSEPYTNPYDVAIGHPADYRAWIVPPAILKDGLNKLQFTLEKGDPASVFYLDLAVQ